MVIFLYELGKALEKLAVNRSRKSVSELMNIKEENSNLKEEDTIKSSTNRNHKSRRYNCRKRRRKKYH